MKGRIVKDWSKVDINNRDHRAKVIGAVQHFVAGADRADVGAALQLVATQTDFPASVLEVIEKFQQVKAFDNAWERLFTLRDYTSSNRDGFTILDVGDGLTFEEIPKGEKVKIHKMAGEKATVNFAMYGGGLGWHRTLFDDKEYWHLEENAIAFNNKWLHKRAQVGYALIEAIDSGRNVSWQAAAPNVASTDANYLALRDIATINAACLGILTDLKDKGYGVDVSSSFELIAPLALRDRINRALSGPLNAGVSGATLKGVNFNVTPNFTLNLQTNQTTYYVGIPGIKSIWGNRMNLTIFDQFDPTSYSDIAVGWARMGGAIGDVQQIRRCATA